MDECVYLGLEWSAWVKSLEKEECKEHWYFYTFLCHCHHSLHSTITFRHCEAIQRLVPLSFQISQQLQWPYRTLQLQGPQLQFKTNCAIFSSVCVCAALLQKTNQKKKKVSFANFRLNNVRSFPSLSRCVGCLSLRQCQNALSPSGTVKSQQVLVNLWCYMMGQAHTLKEFECSQWLHCTQVQKWCFSGSSKHQEVWFCSH